MARDRDDDRDNRDNRDDRNDDRPRRDRDDDRPRRSRNDDRPRRRDRDDTGPPAKQASVLGILALVGGIPSVAVTFVPCCGWVFGIIGGVVVLTLGVIGLVLAKGSNGRVGSGLPLAGTILGAVAILISLLWLLLFTVLAATTPTTPGGSTGSPVSPSDPVAASLPAADLVAEFKNNEPAADAKYKGKVVEVTGRVKLVSDLGGVSDISVELDGVNLASVDCHFASTQRAAVSGLTPGTTVTVRGRCAGLVVFDVELNDCIVMPGGPSKPSGTTPTSGKATPTGPKPGAGANAVKAADLAKAFADDEDAADTKYKDKVIEVTGPIYRMKLLGTDTPSIVLGEKGKEVVCLIGADEKREALSYTFGKVLTYRGKCVGLDGTVTLEDCKLVK